MDFVLRDAYMSGYSTRAFDLDRLLHYSAFTTQGLTIHERGLSALVRFISVRAELFRAIYFHRTVRAIDLELQELFLDSKQHLFPGNPLEHLDEYQRLTEWSLLMEVARWPASQQPELRELGLRWQQFLRRGCAGRWPASRRCSFGPGEAEQGSVFSNAAAFEAAVRRELPPELRDLPLRVDTARHVHRPGAHTPAAGQNFLYDPATGRSAASTTASCSAGSPSAIGFAAFTPWTTATMPSWPPPWTGSPGRRRGRRDEYVRERGEGDLMLS